jgi:acyl-CoA thioester hydrolase
MHKFELSVRGYELDSLGHVNNSVYLNYFEQARWELFRDLDLADYFKEYGLMLVVTEIKIRYSREVKLFDKLEVKTKVKKEAPYLVFEQKIYFKGTSVKVSSCEVKTLFINSEKVKFDIPESFAKKLFMK